MLPNRFLSAMTHKHACEEMRTRAEDGCDSESQSAPQHHTNLQETEDWSLMMAVAGKAVDAWLRMFKSAQSQSSCEGRRGTW